MSIPKFLESKPEPTIEPRLYHGSQVPLWRGMVRLSAIQGWAENPRLELEAKRWQNDHAGAEITQEILYDMMKKTKHVRLDELSRNIVANGLREPIVLTFDGRLLDGNRRFFAAQLAYDNAKTLADKEKLEIIPAFVLQENATDNQINNILVEENFTPSLKEEWPYYVKAEHIRRAKEEDGMTVQEIAYKFGWSTSKVRDTLHIANITDAFITYATGEPDSDEGGLGLSTLDAESVAAVNYQFFNEAKKSFREPLANNPDFAELFFTLIAKNDKEKFFSRFDEVRCAYDGYNDPIGRPIMEKGDAGAGKDLKALIQMKNSNLEDRQDAEAKITAFVKFLKDLKAEQIRTISDATYENLRESLVLVQNLVETAKKQE